MTENDKKLIAEARQTPYSWWDRVGDMIEKADTEECKKELHDIEMRLFHLEEASADMI